jgi:hypothetical protein
MYIHQWDIGAAFEEYAFFSLLKKYFTKTLLNKILTIFKKIASNFDIQDTKIVYVFVKISFAMIVSLKSARCSGGTYSWGLFSVVILPVMFSRRIATACDCMTLLGTA